MFPSVEPESRRGKQARKGDQKRARKGDKANGKAKENISTHHDALMRQNPFHPPPAKKYYMSI